MAALDLRPALFKNPHCCMPEKPNSRPKKLTRKQARELDVKISFIEGVVKRDPQYVEALQILGDFYAERGSFEKSLVVDQQLSALQPENSLVFYNLACSYSLNQDYKLAAAALDKAITLGYRDFKWLAKDPDLRILRQHPEYRSIEAKIRKMRVRIA